MNTTKSSKTYAQFYSHVHSKAHSPRSREVYLRWVERLGEYYQPEGPGLRRLSERQVLDYLIYLRDDQKLAASTVNQALVPIRTLYLHVTELSEEGGRKAQAKLYREVIERALRRRRRRR